MEKIGRAFCFLLALLLTLPGGAALAADFDFVINNQYNGDWQPIPKAYVLKKSVSYFGAEFGSLNAPSDLDITRDGHVFIADTGNNRILELDENLEAVASYENEANKGLRAPQGVFIDPYGAIFVADTDNNRIVKLSSSGGFVEEFTRPVSPLLGENYNFTPRSVAVSSTGYLYAIRLQYLMQIDAQGDFCGYIGTTQVGFDLGYKLRQLLSNERQRVAIRKREPASILNFDLMDNGVLYVTTVDTTAQLKKINSVGKNTYPYTGAFGYNIGSGENIRRPVFADVAVNRNEIVALLETVAGQIHLYDADGNNLCIFGGLGEGGGRLNTPVALEIDDGGCVYVIDQKRRSLNVYEPTYMMRQVLAAVTLYADGKYHDAAAYWEKILEIDSNFTLANAGLAKAYFKQGDYEKAMHYYRIAEDKDGYSEAYAKYKTEYVRHHFPVVVGGALGIAALLIALVKGLLCYTRVVMRRYDSMI